MRVLVDLRAFKASEVQFTAGAFFSCLKNKEAAFLNAAYF